MSELVLGELKKKLSSRSSHPLGRKKIHYEAWGYKQRDQIKRVLCKKEQAEILLWKTTELYHMKLIRIRLQVAWKGHSSIGFKQMWFKKWQNVSHLERQEPAKDKAVPGAMFQDSWAMPPPFQCRNVYNILFPLLTCLCYESLTGSGYCGSHFKCAGILHRIIPLCLWMQGDVL